MGALYSHGEFFRRNGRPDKTGTCYTIKKFKNTLKITAMIFNPDEWKDNFPAEKKLSQKEELLIWSIILLAGFLLGLIIWASLQRII